MTNLSRYRASRGFTLIELMVGCALGAIVVAAAFAFARTQTRQLSVTTERLYMTELGRSTIELLTDDLRHAGAGVGYAGDGTFAGLFSGAYTLGHANFHSQNASTINLLAGTGIPVDDIGVMFARGGYATVAEYSASGSAQMCDGADIKDGEMVLLRSESGQTARAVIVSRVRSAGCDVDSCVGGCLAFDWTADPLWISDPSAVWADYTGGEINGGFMGVVWFVVPDPDNPTTGTLRRAVFDGSHSCAARDSTCGELMARGVETLQMQVWRFDTDLDNWVSATNTALTTTDRLRVDVELVIRGRSIDDKQHDAVALRSEPGLCLPTSCDADHLERVPFRTSVEIMNSSRMAIR